ncbi:MAG: serine/threonine-protein kinase [Kofleriaceae bacterium]
MGAALDRSSLRRMRAFHGFGIIAPLVTLALSLRLGGDPLLHQLFCAGMVLLASSNIVMLATLRRGEETATMIVLWAIAAAGMLPGLLYFGPFSGAILVHLFAIAMVAIGGSALIARVVTGIVLGAHVLMTTPMTLGWVHDRGILSSDSLDSWQKLITELLLFALLASGYAIGRWFRTTSADALRELQSARRALGDQRQALAEIQDAVAEANRWNEGRWTGQVLGGWRLGLVLGRGAMGEVYEAYALDGREAALKLLRPRAETDTLVERFHRELQVVAQLESPFIVRVFEVSPANAEVPYLVMERLRGFDLAAQLQREPRLALGSVVVLLREIAQGLEVARRANVVHRDLKPHNLFCHDGRWKILDFGVAKVIGSEGTLTGDAIVGTPHYMAPEQASNARDTAVTHRADIYALGAIAYRCLTGRTPYAGNDLAGIVYQVVHTTAPRPSSFADVPQAIEDVLAVAMAKDPASRFASALEFAERMAAAAERA